jgi:hypothetical protein
MVKDKGYEDRWSLRMRKLDSANFPKGDLVILLVGLWRAAIQRRKSLPLHDKALRFRALPMLTVAGSP